MSAENPKERESQSQATSKSPDRKPLVVLENPHAPDVFASWVHSVGHRHGNIHVTFVSDRFNQSESQPTMVVIGRLVMPIQGARDMLVHLYGMLQEMGEDPLAAPTKDKVQ
jgi:hypothetical protein